MRVFRRSEPEDKMVYGFNVTLRSTQEPYQFVSWEKFIEDFYYANWVWLVIGNEIRLRTPGSYQSARGELMSVHEYYASDEAR